MSRSIGLMFTTWISLMLPILTVSALRESISMPLTDATGLVQGTATFSCQVEYGYYEAMTRKFKNTLIYQFLDGMPDYPLRNDKYKVTKSERNFTLEITDLTYNDAGEYTCLVTIVSAKAVLMVLDKPSITIYPLNPVEGDTVIYGCEACFRGTDKDLSLAQYPELKLVFGSTPLSGEIQTNHTKEFSCMKMVLNKTVDTGENGQQISCEIRTSRPEKSHISVATLNAFYPVRNASYFPEGAKFEVGTNLTCMADGNPLPTFEWENQKKPGTVLRGKWLNITGDLVGHNLWKCTGQNYFGNVSYIDSIEVSFQALHHSEPGEGGKSFPGYTYIVIILLLANVGFLAYFLYKKIKKRGSGRNSNRAEDGDGRQLDLQSLVGTIEALQKKEDLDSKAPGLFIMLDKHGKNIMASDPDIILKLVEKCKNRQFSR